jgi:hypothetical protein
MTAPDVRPEPSRADVERYAEALGIRSYHAAHPNAREDVDRVLALVAQDRAVDAATIEGLRAEVERLRSDAGVDARGTSRAERLWGLVKTYRADLEASEDRAEAAESALTEARERLSRLRALADEHKRTCNPAPYTSERALIERLEAVLAGVAEQEAGEAVCVCPDDFCLGAEGDQASGTAECAACLALDPELPCLRESAPSGSDDTKGALAAGDADVAEALGLNPRVLYGKDGQFEWWQTKAHWTEATR